MAQQNKVDHESLRDQVVVITGGSSGIGLATARMAIAKGVSVVLLGRALERLEQACQELGSTASTV
jgi:NADP-dependent 3-hydroxy acid dehydrogenase YdfG